MLVTTVEVSFFVFGDKGELIYVNILRGPSIFPSDTSAYIPLCLGFFRTLCVILLQSKQSFCVFLDVSSGVSVLELFF